MVTCLVESQAATYENLLLPVTLRGHLYNRIHHASCSQKVTIRLFARICVISTLISLAVGLQ